MHATCKVGTNEDQPKEKSKGCLSEQGSQLQHLPFSGDSKAGRGVAKLCNEEKGGFRGACLEAVGTGELQAGQQQGPLCDWLGEHLWLSLVGPKLEAGTTFREVVSY